MGLEWNSKRGGSELGNWKDDGQAQVKNEGGRRTGCGNGVGNVCWQGRGV